MTLEELAKLGRRLRNAQKRFFASRDSGVLRECRSLEKDFDEDARPGAGRSEARPGGPVRSGGTRTMSGDLGLGATGKFPEGRLGPHDEGELKAALCIEGGKVVLRLGKPVAWLAMTAEQAEGLSALLLKWAKKAKEAR